MNIKLDPNEVLTDFILDYSEHCLTLAEELSFRDLMVTDPVVKRSADSNKRIRNVLKELPKVNVSESFDRKMAAAFALELENETIRNNKVLNSGKVLIS
jgi:hypothetical protein